MHADAKLTLAIAGAIGHYDALAPRLPEREARTHALAYLLAKIPTIEELDGAVMLADTLAHRAERKHRS